MYTPIGRSGKTTREITNDLTLVSTHIMSIFGITTGE